MSFFENKENDAKAQIERTNKLLGEPSHQKVRRSVLKEFDPFAPDSPLVPKQQPQPIVDEEEIFEDAETSLPSYLCPINKSLSEVVTPLKPSSYGLRESLLIPELKDCRTSQLLSLNDTNELSFAECNSQLNITTSEDDFEFNYKPKTHNDSSITDPPSEMGNTVKSESDQSALMDKTLEESGNLEPEQQHSCRPKSDTEFTKEQTKEALTSELQNVSTKSDGNNQSTIIVPSEVEINKTIENTSDNGENSKGLNDDQIKTVPDSEHPLDITFDWLESNSSNNENYDQNKTVPDSEQPMNTMFDMLETDSPNNVETNHCNTSVSSDEDMNKSFESSLISETNAKQLDVDNYQPKTACDDEQVVNESFDNCTNNESHIQQLDVTTQPQTQIVFVDMQLDNTFNSTVNASQCRDVLSNDFDPLNFENADSTQEDTLNKLGDPFEDVGPEQIMEIKNEDQTFESSLRDEAVDGYTTADNSYTVNTDASQQSFQEIQIGHVNDNRAIHQIMLAKDQPINEIPIMEPHCVPDQVNKRIKALSQLKITFQENSQEKFELPYPVKNNESLKESDKEQHKLNDFNTSSETPNTAGSFALEAIIKKEKDSYLNNSPFVVGDTCLASERSNESTDEKTSVWVPSELNNTLGANDDKGVQNLQLSELKNPLLKKTKTVDDIDDVEPLVDATNAVKTVSMIPDDKYLDDNISFMVDGGSNSSLVIETAEQYNVSEEPVASSHLNSTFETSIRELPESEQSQVVNVMKPVELQPILDVGDALEPSSDILNTDTITAVKLVSLKNNFTDQHVLMNDSNVVEGGNASFVVESVLESSICKVANAPNQLNKTTVEASVKENMPNCDVSDNQNISDPPAEIESLKDENTDLKLSMNTSHVVHNSSCADESVPKCGLSQEAFEAPEQLNTTFEASVEENILKHDLSNVGTLLEPSAGIQIISDSPAVDSVSLKDENADSKASLNASDVVNKGSCVNASFVIESSQESVLSEEEGEAPKHLNKTFEANIEENLLKHGLSNVVTPLETSADIQNINDSPPVEILSFKDENADSNALNASNVVDKGSCTNYIFGEESGPSKKVLEAPKLINETFEGNHPKHDLSNVFTPLEHSANVENINDSPAVENVDSNASLNASDVVNKGSCANVSFVIESTQEYTISEEAGEAPKQVNKSFEAKIEENLTEHGLSNVTPLESSANIQNINDFPTVEILSVKDENADSNALNTSYVVDKGSCTNEIFIIESKLESSLSNKAIEAPQQKNEIFEVNVEENIPKQLSNVFTPLEPSANIQNINDSTAVEIVDLKESLNSSYAVDKDTCANASFVVESGRKSGIFEEAVKAPQQINATFEASAEENMPKLDITVPNCENSNSKKPIKSSFIVDVTDTDASFASDGAAESESAVEALARSMNQTIDVEESAIVEDVDSTDTSGDNNLNDTVEIVEKVPSSTQIALRVAIEASTVKSGVVVDRESPFMEIVSDTEQEDESNRRKPEENAVVSREVETGRKSVNIAENVVNNAKENGHIETANAAEASNGPIDEKVLIQATEHKTEATDNNQISENGDSRPKPRLSNRLECRPNIRSLRNKTQVITNPLALKADSHNNDVTLVQANNEDDKVLVEYKKKSDELKLQVDKLQDELDKIQQDNMQKDQCILSHALDRESHRITFLKYKKILKEYEDQVVKQCQDLNVLRGQSEKRAKQFTSTEMAFSDLFGKYERSKTVIDACRRNEMILTDNINKAENQLAELNAKCKALQTYCHQEVKKVQDHINHETETYKQNIAKLQSMVKRLEIKASSLDIALRQKSEECQALAALCDDLTGGQPT